VKLPVSPDDFPEMTSAALELDAIADYSVRGRSFGNRRLDELRRELTRVRRGWFADRLNLEKLRRFEGVSSEFRLRGEEPPRMSLRV
jgi:hypothetical protein